MAQVAGLTAGRVVHFVPSESDPAHTRAGINHGNHRAALIVFVWNESGTVDLLVCYDGENDGRARSQPVAWETSVPHDPHGQHPRSWHFQERVE